MVIGWLVKKRGLNITKKIASLCDSSFIMGRIIYINHLLKGAKILCGMIRDWLFVVANYKPTF